ncbi:phage head closure protein [Aureibacillus halotolerans]|uniref:SPP1 family predicted phage head-tail adaptor n=1 Tax=Aureibacillus halotolerans TaxID=1508390 RepID=A0A4R6U849_9BACI|nr:phage head closure protein [Aureibacillus halotolerans]TDQ39234.1 SPP1 family predicted phage head-tail adaptor [Aureibacillus halotolerans]
MNPGKLDRRLEILEFKRTVDEEGFPTDEWVPTRKIWASRETLSGRAYFEASAAQSEVSEQFTVRYGNKLTDDEKRVRCGGEAFVVEAFLPDPMGDRSESHILVKVVSE